ncbi:MAG: hypothetical protein WCO00_18065 [Rhodospirillaceae bacterium]
MSPKSDCATTARRARMLAQVDHASAHAKAERDKSPPATNSVADAADRFQRARNNERRICGGTALESREAQRAEEAAW